MARQVIPPSGSWSTIAGLHNANYEELYQKTDAPAFINITRTQVSSPAGDISVTGTGSTDLWPPSAPQPITGGNYEGYVKVGDLINNDSEEMTLSGGEDVDIISSGRYRVDGFATFAHSLNGSVVAFVFAVDIGGSYVFSPRPVKHRVPNGGEAANMAGEGIISAAAGYQTSLWVASNNSGSISIDTLSIIIQKFAEL